MPLDDYGGTVPRGGHKSRTDRTAVLKVMGGEETITLPIQVSTKAAAVKEMLADRLSIRSEQLEFFCKQGAYTRKVNDLTEMQPKVLVKGISTFKRVRREYSNPHVIVGAGHGGLRQSLQFVQQGQENFVCLERRERLGGNSWLEWANPQSKIQTEFGTYHLNYSPLSPIPTASSPWPNRDELLEGWEKVVDEEGVRPHLRFGTEVLKFKIIPDANDSRTQHYEFTLREEGREFTMMGASFLFFCGNLTNPRREEFKGEDVFEGRVNYGMFSETDYSHMTGNTVAICGFGAFAVENIRTCCEYQARKIHLICRRKNLCMPRIVSWEIDNSVISLSAALVLRHMQPVYDLIGDDPWQYYAVKSNVARTNVSVQQTSRFGIGDVYFLSRYFGACELHVGQVERLTKNSIHLSSGHRLENVSAILKLFGFLGEWSVDKLLQLKKMTGFWVNGDYRRAHFSEPPTVNATRFSGNSYSPGICAASEWFTHMLDYPLDFAKIMDLGVMTEHSPDPKNGIPGYVLDAKLAASTMITISSTLPILRERGDFLSDFKRQRNLETHSLRQIVDAAAEEWNRYCEMFKGYGYEKPAPPYPYPYEIAEEMLRQSDEEGAEFWRKTHERAIAAMANQGA